MQIADEAKAKKHYVIHNARWSRQDSIYNT